MNEEYEIYMRNNTSLEPSAEISRVSKLVQREKRFLKALNTAEGRIKISLEALWIADETRYQEFWLEPSDLPKMENILSIIRDAIQKDIDLQTASLIALKDDLLKQISEVIKD